MDASRPLDPRQTRRKRLQKLLVLVVQNHVVIYFDLLRILMNSLPPLVVIGQVENVLMLRKHAREYEFVTEVEL